MVVIAPVIVPAIVHRQRRIVNAFRDAGATAPERATTFARLSIEGGHTERLLRSHGILRDAGDQRLWLDEASWQAHEAKRQRFAMTMAGVGIGIVALIGIVAWIANR